MNFEDLLKSLDDEIEEALKIKADLKERKEKMSRREKYADLRAQIEEDNKAIEEALGCDHRKQRGRTAPNRALCCEDCECEDDIECYICELEAVNEELEDENDLLRSVIVDLVIKAYLN